jgi:hypothetical protein
MANVSLPEVHRAKFPLSDIRHLGQKDVIEYAYKLRTYPGKDLGAEALAQSRSAPAITPVKTPRRRRPKKGEGEEDQDLPNLSEEERQAKEAADAEVARLVSMLAALQEETAKQEGVLKTFGEAAADLGGKIKVLEKEADGMDKTLEEITIENNELIKDLARSDDSCVQSRISVNQNKAAIDELNTILLEAEKAKDKGNGVCGEYRLLLHV